MICSAKIYNKFDAVIKNYKIFKKCVFKGFCHKKSEAETSQIVVGEGGLEPPNGFPDRFTVCCNCHYATPPRMKELFVFV